MEKLFVIWSLELLLRNSYLHFGYHMRTLSFDLKSIVCIGVSTPLKNTTLQTVQAEHPEY